MRPVTDGKESGKDTEYRIRKPGEQERETVYVIRAMMKTEQRGVTEEWRLEGGESFHQEAWRIPLDPVITLFPLRYPPNCGGGG